MLLLTTPNRSYIQDTTRTLTYCSDTWCRPTWAHNIMNPIQRTPFSCSPPPTSEQPSLGHVLQQHPHPGPPPPFQPHPAHPTTLLCVPTCPSPHLVRSSPLAACCSSSSARSAKNAACPDPGGAPAMSLSYSSLSLVSRKHLSSTPAGMKYSARRMVKAKLTVPSFR